MVVILLVVVVLVVVVVVVEVMEVTMVVEGPVASEWRWWFSGLCWILVVLALTLALAVALAVALADMSNAKGLSGS